MTKLFREVVLWLGGGTTCFWNERSVDAEFQSWEEGFWGTNRRERGTGGETGRRGVSLTSLHESHSEGDRERGYVSSKKHTRCHFQYLVGLRCGESETEVNEVNSSESSRFALLHFR